MHSLPPGTGSARLNLALALGGAAAGQGLPPGVDRVVRLADGGAIGAHADVRAQAAELPFRSATFVAAACDGLLAAAADPEGTLAEVVRVVQPGGLLWLREPVAASERPGGPGPRALSMEELAAHVAGESLGVVSHSLETAGQATVPVPFAIWLLRVGPG